jgi:hypothetical protein
MLDPTYLNRARSVVLGCVEPHQVFLRIPDEGPVRDDAVTLWLTGTPHDTPAFVISNDAKQRRTLTRGGDRAARLDDPSG